MNPRTWIARALWSGGASLGIAVVSGLLSFVLHALGDHSGSDAVRGVALVTMTGFALALIVLVILLALTELSRPERTTDNED